ncbi:MAG: transposase [Ignavibacteriales bacterium]|nr:transposase [Ignavibacteriales bacterium]
MLKQNPQLTFSMQEDNQMRQKTTMLDTINAVIDFQPMSTALEQLYNRQHGRPAIPPLMLFKLLLLEQWYNLSDADVVDAVHDVRSFERFVGQEIRQYHVDDTTLVKFRNRLRAAQRHEYLFDLLNEQLEKRKLFVKLLIPP